MNIIVGDIYRRTMSSTKPTFRWLAAPQNARFMGVRIHLKDKIKTLENFF
jgi:hypothetical protein